jgi:hypothetical protein
MNLDRGALLGLARSLSIALLAASCAFTVIAFPARAQTSNGALHLKEATDCMLKALKAVPGVSQPRLGNATSGGWTHPFLEYRATEDSHWQQPTRFDLEKSDEGRILFVAMLPGMGRIDSHVTDVVVQKWKEQCGVDVVVLFE